MNNSKKGKFTPKPKVIYAIKAIFTPKGKVNTERRNNKPKKGRSKRRKRHALPLEDFVKSCVDRVVGHY